MATTHADDWLDIGRIVAPQGLHGELRVYPDSDFPERFTIPGDRWLLRSGRSDPELVQLIKGRFVESKGLYIITLDQVSDRSQAEALRGAKLLVPSSDRPPLAAGEFHLMDLIGLTVRHAASREVIGTVTGLVPAGNDLLEIQMHHNPEQTALVPFVPELVTDVDLPQKQLLIQPIPGLLPT